MKKLFSVMLAAVLVVGTVLSLSSCGDGLGFKKDTFKIGATGPLTGDASSYGVSVRKGAQLAIKTINANGGLNGVEFSFDMKDDKAEALPAQNGYQTLFEKGMQASIGSVTSGSGKSFAESALTDHVFALTPSASAADVIAVGSNIFRVCFGDPQQGTIAADKLTETYSKIGVIYDTSDTYSSGIYAAFAAEMTVLNKAKDTDYVVYTFDRDNNKDFSSQISGLQSAGCDVLFLPIYYTEAGLIAKAAARSNLNVPIFGCDGLDGIANQLDSTVTAQISYITPFDVNSTEATVSAFVSAYQAEYNETPDQFAADGYDAIMIIYEAMKTANVTDVNISASSLCDVLVATLTSSTFSYSGVTGKNMTWTTEGSCNKAPNIVVLAR